MFAQRFDTTTDNENNNVSKIRLTEALVLIVLWLNIENNRHFKKMCGIYCQIGCCETQPISVREQRFLFYFLYRIYSQPANISFQIHDYTKQLLVRRGPQSQKEHFFRSNDYHAFFLGSVLWHQGDTIAEQPAILGNHVLLWNGDIFSDEIDSHSSDTEYLLTAFSKCETEDEIFKIFRCIKGPYSFIYFNMDSKRLYFGRDIYGRHSLLLGKCDNGDVVISSVLGKDSMPFQEYFSQSILDGVITEYSRLAGA